MAKPNEKLANSLQRLKQIQDGGRKCPQSKDFTRTDRERLIRNGFLKEITKGWYLITDPKDPTIETTILYSNYWDFCKEYLNERFGNNWCLSPEQSLLLLAGNKTVPNQLMVRAPSGNNNNINVMNAYSIFDLKLDIPAQGDVIQKDGLNLYELSAALIGVSEQFYKNNPMEARSILASQSDGSKILEKLLHGSNTVIAGRLAGGFRNIGRADIADEILSTMRSIGHEIRERDPFDFKIDAVELSRARPPFVTRLRLMWHDLRAQIINEMPKLEPKTIDKGKYLNQINEKYLSDAYHSLSIEGYRVSAELIERVRSGNWNPTTSQEDEQNRNAMAARGYYLCFNSVKDSIIKVIDGGNPGTIAKIDHRNWYRQLFSPSVECGLIPASSLAGYRNTPVYIKGSQHVPLNPDTVSEAMEEFFRLLENETDALVRVVLGHFIFVFIHPYLDGNGRIARFLMNLLIAATGQNWTIIKLEQRNDYMQALEIASIKLDILPFAKFILNAINES